MRGGKAASWRDNQGRLLSMKVADVGLAHAQGSSGPYTVVINFKTQGAPFAAQ